MRKTVSYLLLLLAISSILIPVGIGYTREEDVKLEVAAGELKVSGCSFTINPCKYVYSDWVSKTRVSTTISNISDKDAKFDLGDGQVVMIPARGNITHSYQVLLKGQTERIRITKLETQQSSGITTQEQLVLKIVPKGGDER